MDQVIIKSFGKQWKNGNIYEPRFFLNFTEVLEDNNLTLKNFTSKYGKALKNKIGDLLYQMFIEKIYYMNIVNLFIFY